jgi:hypothetical protein
VSDGYATLRPRHLLLDVLASIASYADRKHHQERERGQDKRRVGLVGAWCIASQTAILDWHARMMKRLGWSPASCTMCRRTLNYHLAALERDRYIERTQRHRYHPDNRRGIKHPRAGKLDLRPTLYKFTSLGRLWIKRRVDREQIPLGRLAVQEIAQSGLNSELRLSKPMSGAVDKSPTAPAKGRGKTAALRRPVPTLTSRPLQGPAPRRSATRRVRKAPAQRQGRSPASRKPRRRRGS